VGKGYADGPQAEEAEAERDRIASGTPVPRRTEVRNALFGSTRDETGPHFLGWADEVDADALFARGDAWGLSTRAIAVP
jgi:hypothetical protein